MMNRFKAIVFLLAFFVIGCSANENDIKQRIANQFLENVYSVAILKSNGPDGYISEVTSDKELQIIKKQLLEIKDLKEYSSEAVTGNYNGKEYHALSFFKINKGKKIILGLLYYSKDNTVLIRKSDLYPDFVDKPGWVTVYEFNVSKEFISVLKAHEKELPKDGYYYSAWTF